MRKPLNTLLVGFGSVAVGIGEDKKMAEYIHYQTHAQVLNDHPDFVWNAVVDPNKDAQKLAKEKWSIPIVCDSIQSLPPSYEPDVVVITTRPDVRMEIIESLAIKKGILVEKPLGYNLEDSKKFVSICNEKDIKVQVNLFRRADKTNHNLLDNFLDENIGEIQAGFSIYGNGLLNNGIHIIDLVRMLFGEIKSVQSMGNAIPANDSVVKNDVNVAFTMQLNNDINFFASPLDFKKYRDVMLDIWGTKGRLEIFQEGLFLRCSPLKEHRALENTNEVAIDESFELKSYCGEAYYEIYENFSAALNGECDLYSDMKNALNTEIVVDAILQSVNTGNKKININV